MHFRTVLRGILKRTNSSTSTRSSTPISRTSSATAETRRTTDSGVDAGVSRPGGVGEKAKVQDTITEESVSRPATSNDLATYEQAKDDSDEQQQQQEQQQQEQQQAIFSVVTAEERPSEQQSGEEFAKFGGASCSQNPGTDRRLSLEGAMNLDIDETPADTRPILGEEEQHQQHNQHRQLDLKHGHGQSKNPLLLVHCPTPSDSDGPTPSDIDGHPELSLVK